MHTIALPKPYRLLTQHQIGCECSLNPARSYHLFLLKGHSLVQPHSGLPEGGRLRYAWSAGFQIWCLICQAVRLTANSSPLQVYDYSCPRHPKFQMTLHEALIVSFMQSVLLHLFCFFVFCNQLPLYVLCCLMNLKSLPLAFSYRQIEGQGATCISKMHVISNWPWKSWLRWIISGV